MRFRLSALVLLSLAATLVACAPAAEQPAPAMEEIDTTEADVEAINSVREREGAAAIAGDAESFVALITDDAVFMPPNEPPVTGKEAIRSWLQDFFDQFTIEYTPSFGEIVVAGDWAFESYSWTWTLTPVAGGEPISDSMKCVHIYQRQPDGSWKIARDIWNSDNPPPEM